ncbi:MAG: phycobilisome protein [Leptolyngbyaceae cyanobacterium]
MSTSPLSEKVRELIRNSRIVSFASWDDTYSTDVIQCLQTADDESRYLTDEDLSQLQTWVPETAASLAIVRAFRDQASAIVDEARSQVLETFPGITQADGDLYPAERAKACWRDFWHFLRCITYGIAGQRTDYTSPDGLHSMQLLYQELQVPLEAMVVGLEGIKQASLKRLAASTPDAAPYFDHLIHELKQFR